MKFPPSYAAFICAGLLAAPAFLYGQPAPFTPAGPLGPRMTFTTNEYHFGKVVAGELVKHTFIVSNAGDQTLVISNVAPGCHCTTAGKWTPQIEPGKTGEIPIQFDSGGFQGVVTKTISVTSNDKHASVQSLYMKGTVWQAIEVSPRFAYINVMPDDVSNASTVVHITNLSDEPINLFNPTSSNNKFKAELKIIKPGKVFELIISVVPPLSPENVPGTISVRTSLTNMPVISVTALTMVEPALNITPMQIALPPVIDRWTTNSVTITANGKKPLALSDLSVSDPRISVALKETIPGRSFQVVMVFPPGFQFGQGQRARVSLKSNSSEHPVIVVPVWQFPYSHIHP